jgi:hypothetical protein
MWQKMNTGIYKNIKTLVKAEFSYNFAILTGLGIFFAGYTIITLFDIQLLSGPMLDVDFWGALFAFFFYLLIYSMWIVRLKEKRIRLHSTLPVSQRTNAISRMLFIVSIIIISFIYITVQLVLVPSWYDESSGIFAQLGFVFIVFSLFIISRDLWYLNSKKLLNNTWIIFLTLIVLLSISASIFIYVRPFLYDISGAYAGRAVFLVWAIILTVFTTYTFVKRKQYLS